MVEFASDVLFEDDVAVTFSVNVFESDDTLEDDVWFEDDVAVTVSFIVFESVPLEEVAFEDVAFKADVTVTVSVNVFEDEAACASVYQGMNIMVRHNRRIKPYTFINKEE